MAALTRVGTRVWIMVVLTFLWPNQSWEPPPTSEGLIMKSAKRTLILIDALVNLGLGLAFVASPSAYFRVLGLPVPSTRLYTAILGAVLIGIGLALILWLRSHEGLGPSGAIAINLLGSLAALVWLTAHWSLTAATGRFLVASVAGAVLVLAVLELRAGFRSTSRRRN
jgi:hypothetical protein